MRHSAMALVLLALAASCNTAPAGPGAGQPPASASAAAAGLRFTVRFGPEVQATPLDGRLLLLLGTRADGEPRFQLSGDNDTGQVFGVDVEGLAPGQDASIGADTLGSPVARLADLPPGDYWCRRSCTATRPSIAPTVTR